MQVASSLEFLPAARRLREGLFERLRAGSLPGELSGMEHCVVSLAPQA